MSEKFVKIVSWNVNGLRAAIAKDFFSSVKKIDPDVLAIQETKLQESQLTDEMRRMEGYESFWSHCTIKKGYSGVGLYSRIKPVQVRYGIGKPEYDQEGRIIEADFGAFVLFNIYFPNGQMSEERLTYKLNFYKDFFAYTDQLKNRGRRLIIAGDFNTAHNEIDLKNPKANEKYSGFLRIERDWFDRITANGYRDTFRYLYPNTVKYSWWSYRFKARERNIGWRVDYMMVSNNLMDEGWIAEAFIDDDIYGSDHCPVGVNLRSDKLDIPSRGADRSG